MLDPMPLRGLNAANPLAFLAAVGALRSLALAWPEEAVRIHWARTRGVLRPFLTSERAITQDELVAVLADQLRSLASNPALALADDLTVDPTRFRAAAEGAQRSGDPRHRSPADFLAAFGCESLVDAKTGLIQDTAMRTMSGAGHQHFLRFMRQLAAETSRRCLRDALFHPWRYGDPGPSLRWDPADDRRYALRWKEPSGDPIRTVRGANALAAQALPLFPTQPRTQGLLTTGLSRIPRRGTFLSWPIWDRPIPLDVVKSLLALKEIQDPRPQRPRLAAIGVIEVFRCRRITQGKYRNFTSGVPV